VGDQAVFSTKSNDMGGHLITLESQTSCLGKSPTNKPHVTTGLGRAVKVVDKYNIYVVVAGIG
jgi:hypothetical protein